MQRPRLARLLAVIALFMVARSADAAPARAGAVALSVTPASIVLDKAELIDLVVRGLTGTGPVKTAVNVGVVKGIEVNRDSVRIHYQVPTEQRPQRLCLLLWRTKSHASAVVHVPLLAYARISVKTRRHSKVTIEVAGKAFGPKSSGRSGRVTMRVLVPPGVAAGWATAVDRRNLKTRKKVVLGAGSYNTLAAGLRTRNGRHELMLAASDPSPTPPRAQLVHESGEARPLMLESVGAERWKAVWRPPQNRPGQWTLQISVPGVQTSTAQLAFVVKEPKVAPPPPVVRRPRQPSPPTRLLRWTMAVAAGLQHNIGEFFSPRFALEFGATYPLGPGRIGLRLIAAIGWSSQDVPVPAIGSNPESSVASTSLLMPLSALVSYQLAWGRFTPYGGVGPVLQLVQTSSDGESTGKRRSLTAAVGVLALLGVQLRLGPGGIFAQAGFEYSSVSSRDVELLAGGVVAELGYRYEL